MDASINLGSYFSVLLSQHKNTSRVSWCQKGVAISQQKPWNLCLVSVFQPLTHYIVDIGIVSRASVYIRY